MGAPIAPRVSLLPLSLYHAITALHRAGGDGLFGNNSNKNNNIKAKRKPFSIHAALAPPVSPRASRLPQCEARYGAVVSPPLSPLHISPATSFTWLNNSFIFLYSLQIIIHPL